MALKDRKRRLAGGYNLKGGSVTRSHMHPFASRIADHATIYDVGPLPWTWDEYGIKYGAAEKLHYLHSSIKGFVNEYKDIEAEFKLEAFFQSRVESMKKSNTERIEDLKKASKKVKKDILGGDPEKDVNECAVIQTFYNKNAPFLTQLDTLRSMVTFQFLDQEWIDKNNELLQARMEAKNGGDAAKQRHEQLAKQFYSEYATKILTHINYLQQYIDGNPTISAGWGLLKNELAQIKQEVESYIDSGATTIHLKKSHPSQLGKAFEPILASLLQASAQQGLDIVAETIGEEHFLADLIIKKKKKQTVRIQNTAGRFLDGISVKFTNRNRFDTKPTIHVNEGIKDFLNGAAPNQVAAFAYLYNNIIALSLYNSGDSVLPQPRKTKDAKDEASDKKTTGRKAKSARNKVLGTLMTGRNKVGKLFSRMIKYYNLYLINVFLWGNGVDAGNIQPFNPKFFEEMNNKVAPAPVFLANQYQFFETYKIFQNLQDAINKGEYLWTSQLTNAGGGIFTNSTQGTAALQELYATKAAWLMQTSDAIYTVLKNRPMLQPMPSYFSLKGPYGATGEDQGGNIMNTFLDQSWNPYSSILAVEQSRTLRVKVDLFKYY